MIRHWSVASFVAFALVIASQAAPAQATTFTSFEESPGDFVDPNTVLLDAATSVFGGTGTTDYRDFTVGADDDNSAFFWGEDNSADAFAGFRGIGSLYFNGARSWMINAGATQSPTRARIDFNGNHAESIMLWARTNPSATEDLQVRAYDQNLALFDTQTVSPGDGWKKLTFDNSTVGVNAVSFLRLLNPDDTMAAVDNVTFTTVPEPGSVALAGLAGVWMLCHRRRGHRGRSR